MNTVKKTLWMMLCISCLMASAFELPFTDGGNGIPQGWKLSVKDAQCQVTDGIVKLSGVSTGNVYLSYPGLELATDVIYVLSCEARCPVDGDYMIYYEYIKDKAWKSHIFSGSGNGDWQKITVRFFKDDDVTNERVMLRLMNSTTLEVRNLTIEEEKHDHGITDNFPESAPVTRFVHNGSFEWQNKYWTILSDAAAKRSNDNYGNSSLFLGKYGFVVQPNIHLLRNRKYRLSWYAKAEADSGELIVSVRNMPDKSILNADPYTVTSKEFTRKEFDFTAQDVPEPIIDIVIKNTGGKPLSVTQFYLKEYTEEELSPLQIRLEQPCYRDAIFASLPCPFVQGTVLFKDDSKRADVTFTGKNFNLKTTVTAAQPTFKFPTDGMVDGDYLLSVSSATASASRVIHKYPHKPNEVVIDSHNNFLCSGKRFFPFLMGFRYEDPDRPVMSYLCATRGMTGLMGTSVGSAAKALSELNHAQKYGLKVMLWFGGGPSFGTSTDYLQELEATIKGILTPEVINHPALFGYNFSDEPWALEIPAYKFADSFRIFRQLDPWHPVFLNESPRGVVPEYLSDYARYADIYGVDLYPLPAAIRHSAIADKSMAAVGRYSDIYNRATLGKKPVLMWLQGYRWVEKGELAVIPNEQESKFMCLDALMHDTKAIAMFNHNMKSQAYYRDFFAITELVYRVEQVIGCSTEQPSPLAQTGLSARSFSFNNTLYHLLLNETAKDMVLDVSKLADTRLAYGNDSSLNGSSLTVKPWGFALFSSNGQMPPAFQPLTPADEVLEAEKDNFLELFWQRRFPKDLVEAEWIWFPGKVDNHPKIAVDRMLSFDKPVKSVVVSATADNSIRLYLDDNLLIASDDWTLINEIDIAKQLKPQGSNLHIEATNVDGPAGLMVMINVTYQDGSVQSFPSSADWPISAGTVTSPKAQSFGKFGFAPTWDFFRFTRLKH